MMIDDLCVVPSGDLLLDVTYQIRISMRTVFGIEDCLTLFASYVSYNMHCGGIARLRFSNAVSFILVLVRTSASSLASRS